MTPCFRNNADGRPVLDLRAEAARHRPDLADLPELTDDERAMAARTWRGRMVNEHISAQVFASLIPQLMRAAVPPSIQAQVPKMIADEYRHAELCAAVVLALGHTPVAVLPELGEMPSHPDASPLEAVLRNVLSVCCLSETVAVSIIRAEHVELEGGPLGDVLAGILADEVQHARFGWSMLGAVKDRLDAPTLARLSLWLEDALVHLIEYEVPKLPIHLGLRSEVASAGVCDGGAARSLFRDTIEQVILPQLAGIGFDTHTAWERAQARATLAFA